MEINRFQFKFNQNGKRLYPTSLVKYFGIQTDENLKLDEKK